MMIVIFPPTITRNYKGIITQVIMPSYDLSISDEFIKSHNNDIVEAAKNAMFGALISVYNEHISLFQLSEVNMEVPLQFVDNMDGGIFNFHFQIPAWTILPDAMKLDFTSISYYGFARYILVDINEKRE